MKRLIAVGILLILTSCQSAGPVSKTTAPLRPIPPPNSELAIQEEAFFKDLWETYPQFAASVGKHEYGDRLKIPNAVYFTEQHQFLNKYKKIFSGLDRQKYSTSDRMDVDLVLNFIDGALWELDTFKNYQWDPSNYNVGNTVAVVLEGTKKNEKDKLLAVSEKLALVPAYYEAAIKNISRPTKEHTDLAIRQNMGLNDYFEKEVKVRAEKSPLSELEKKLFLERYDAAVKAIAQFVEQLKTLEKKNNFRSFRIGRKLYAEKFKYDIQSSIPADAVYKRAQGVKKQTHEEMAARAKELWPKYFGEEKPPKKSLELIKKVLDKIAEKHAQPNEFLSAIEKDIPVLWDFIEKKDLLTLDPKKRLKVRVTPVYQRGVAAAGIDAPGPFDEYRETYYNVTPLSDMPPEKQQSFLREYNNATLHILNIHEAIPGHYAQLVYSNKNPSLVKKVFGNGAMVEGWAVYGERMMLEEGYGKNDPELWMMYYKWRLRIVANMILDYGIHNLDFSQKQVMDLLINETFQETAEAEEKWKRATYTQVQLTSYFTGFTEIYSLREELRIKMNGRFRLKNFHEKFLSYGSVPVKMIAADMVREVQDANKSAKSL